MPAIQMQYAFSEAKDRLSALTLQANATGTPFIITKNSKPWVEVRPLAVHDERDNAVTITPVKREVSIPDIDALFDGYDGAYVPTEDGFAAPAGHEVM